MVLYTPVVARLDGLAQPRRQPDVFAAYYALKVVKNRHARRTLCVTVPVCGAVELHDLSFDGRYLRQRGGPGVRQSVQHGTRREARERVGARSRLGGGRGHLRGGGRRRRRRGGACRCRRGGGCRRRRGCCCRRRRGVVVGVGVVVVVGSGVVVVGINVHAVDPRTLDCVPGAQSTHAELPGIGLYSPTGHGAHDFPHIVSVKS